VQSFNPVSDFEVLCRSAPPGEGVDDPTHCDQTGGGHAKALAGGAFDLDVNVHVFVISQQRGIVAGFDEIQIEVDLLDVFVVHVSNGDNGGLGGSLLQRCVRFDPRHGFGCGGGSTVEGSGCFDTVVNREPSAFAALAPAEGGGLVNGEQEGDVATAALHNGGHPFIRRSAG
jgi:hypothetical protein